MRRGPLRRSAGRRRPRRPPSAPSRPSTRATCRRSGGPPVRSRAAASAATRSHPEATSHRCGAARGSGNVPDHDRSRQPKRRQSGRSVRQMAARSQAPMTAAPLRPARLPRPTAVSSVTSTYPRPSPKAHEGSAPPRLPTNPSVAKRTPPLGVRTTPTVPRTRSSSPPGRRRD